MNPYRDESTLTMCGQRFVLRPTFQALAEMEGATGVDLVSLAMRLQSGMIGVGMIHAIISAGIKGAGNEVPADLGNLILRAGITKVLPQLVQWISGVFAGESGEEEKTTSTGKA